MGALKHETLALKCEVDASPPADSFHWTFNSSGEPTDLSAKLQSSEVCYDLFLLFFFIINPTLFLRHICTCILIFKKNESNGTANCTCFFHIRAKSHNILSRLITAISYLLFCRFFRMNLDGNLTIKLYANQ